MFNRALIISNYLYILRPKNVLIVAMSQLLIYWVYIMPLINASQIVLDGSLWWLFIIDTVLIASSGYVVNDIFDQHADAFNKPKNSFLGKNKISVKSAWVYYISLVVFGFFIALHIAIGIGRLHLLVIYPVAVSLLFFYSKYFKKLPLVGNVVVALFCAFIPGIILYAEWDTIYAFPWLTAAQRFSYLSLFASYITFAFLSTMVREIVKDIEDVVGDKAVGILTLPIISGKDTARSVALGFGLLLLASYGILLIPYLTDASYPNTLPASLFLFVSTVFVLVRLYKASEKNDFSDVSKWLKILMVVALFVFLCIPF